MQVWSAGRCLVPQAVQEPATKAYFQCTCLADAEGAGGSGSGRRGGSRSSMPRQVRKLG